MKAIPRILPAALVAAISSMALNASTVTPITSRSAAGVPYDWTVTLGANDSAILSNHCGAWSWEDNALFNEGAGEPPVGWTHTSRWSAVTLTVATRLIVRMERDATVPWPSGGDPGRLASTATMFPSFTVWKGFDTDGTQNHTYNNRGNPSWAEDLSFIGLVNNSTQPVIEDSFILPAGDYTFALGSNAPANDTNRQGFRVTLTTVPIATQVVLQGASVVGLPGVTVKKIHSPTLNDSENVAFRAVLAGTGVTLANDTAILSETADGPLAVIVRENSVDPNTGSVFVGFDDPVTDSADNVVFRAKVKTGLGGVSTFNDQGIYRYVAATGAIQLIAREGTVPSGVFDGGTLKFFATAVADEAGGAFMATLAPNGSTVTAANDEGIWVFDTAGVVTLVARQGFPFEVGPGDFRTVKTLHFLTAQLGSRGVGRSTNSAGSRILQLTFSDGSSGVFHIAP